MAFIAFLENSFLATGKEYLLVGDNTLSGCHNPHFATQFESEEKANSLLSEKFSRFEDVTLSSDINGHFDEFNAWLESGGVYREFPMLHSLNRTYNGEDKDEVLEWNFAISKLKEGETRYQETNTWPALSTLFTCIYQTISLSSLEDPEVSYISVEMRVNKDTEFDVFKDELLKVLPFITNENEEGFLVIRVFEHTLCRYGSVYAYVKPDLSCFKIGGRFDDQEYASMDSFFQRWKTEHYYE
tara:strand:- start:664 stop:1389 length:726 start_codon:yes stop_codon:yes gene_type:complete